MFKETFDALLFVMPDAIVVIIAIKMFLSMDFKNKRTITQIMYVTSCGYIMGYFELSKLMYQVLFFVIIYTSFYLIEKEKNIVNIFSFYFVLLIILGVSELAILGTFLYSQNMELEEFNNNMILFSMFSIIIRTAQFYMAYVLNELIKNIKNRIERKRLKNEKSYN